MVRLTRPLGLRREQAAAYCKLSPSAFSQWVSQGRLPKPILGTARDLKAIDRAIDSLSGLNQASRPLWICRERNVRVVLQGIHKVKKRLASGDIKIHYCAWRDGPAIHAKPGTPRVGACPQRRSQHHQATSRRHLDDHHRRVQSGAGIHSARTFRPARRSARAASGRPPNASAISLT
jgi:hypothetical protein